MVPELFWKDVFQPRQHLEAPIFGTPFGPGDGIIEVIELASHDRAVYAFELALNSRLHFDASADGPIALGLAAFDDYNRWMESEVPDAILNGLRLQAGPRGARIQFCAESKDEYAVIVVNLSDTPTQMIIAAQYD